MRRKGGGGAQEGWKRDGGGAEEGWREGRIFAVVEVVECGGGGGVITMQGAAHHYICRKLRGPHKIMRWCEVVE